MLSTLTIQALARSIPSLLTILLPMRSVSSRIWAARNSLSKSEKKARAREYPKKYGAFLAP